MEVDYLNVSSTGGKGFVDSLVSFTYPRKTHNVRQTDKIIRKLKTEMSKFLVIWIQNAKYTTSRLIKTEELTEIVRFIKLAM